ncbi:MAG: DUF4231 domain-containing protein [Hyphomicrobiales bacterium]
MPQRPQLTFAVGITGHRPNKLPAEAAARVESQLAAVFAAIDAACAARRVQDARLYQQMPHRVRLVSGLAEGADQIAVEAMPANWEAMAVLPFARLRYEEDFVTKDENGKIMTDHRAELAAALQRCAAVVELADTSDGAPAAYARAGAFVLRQIDVLVAIWDGAEAAGKGGTAEVVAQALEGGVPVVWIASAHDQAPRLIEHMTDVARSAPFADATCGPIADIVDATLAVNPAGAGRVEDFFEEPWRPHCRWTAYDALRRFPKVWTWRGRLAARGLPDIRKDWDGFMAELPDGGGFKRKLEDLLLPRFAAADALATHFSHAYRSAYVLAYVLAVIAIAIALVGILPIAAEHAEVEEALGIKALLVVLEFLIIAAIIHVVRTGQRHRWHERWLDYRALAEMLRHLRFLAPVGECANHQFPRQSGGRGAEWVLWYLRATIRELGCPSAPVDSTYQRQVLRATERAEIDEQVAWHRKNSEHLRELHHRLLHIGDACFVMTGALLAAFFLGFLGWLALRFGFPSALGSPRAAPWSERLSDLLVGAKPYLTVLSALLPAIGASVSGIRFTGDFDGYAERSAQTAAQLQDLKSDYALALERLEFDRTAVALVDTARVMAEDIVGWQMLYSRKRLTLPA